ncbi:hypothetical protein EJB05_24883 [Eragrostis curvula]|uniref:Uncharacterized protein n=1 Tax=Eragrostis curvula TaxID=38414 RepID=A0A5J9VBQ9_9POAL|nr:hypothetical protein EJB05_24883 [Eragrostis curvula]
MRCGTRILKPAVGVEYGEEDEVVEELVARYRARVELLGVVEDAGGDVGEVRRQLGVVAAHEEGREPDGVEEQVLDQPRPDGLARERVELEGEPLERLGRASSPMALLGGAPPNSAVQAPPQEAVGLDGVEQGGKRRAERRRDVVHPRGGEPDHDALELGVAGVAGVEEGERAVAAEERERRHVRAVERVGLVDLGVVEQDAEAARVEEGHHAGVAGDEGARWHVDAQHGGAAVAGDAAAKELLRALEVVVVQAVAQRREEGHAVASQDLADREA